MGKSVHIAYGLRCLVAAMKAKADKIKRPDVVKLLAQHGELGVDDQDILAAVQIFADIVDHDPAGAGRDLHEFLLTWREGLVSTQTADVAEVLPQQDPGWPKEPPAPKAEPEPETVQPSFDWQNRVDING